jgi:hypothetical protein
VRHLWCETGLRDRPRVTSAYGRACAGREDAAAHVPDPHGHGVGLLASSRERSFPGEGAMARAHEVGVLVHPYYYVVEDGPPSGVLAVAQIIGEPRSSRRFIGVCGAGDSGELCVEVDRYRHRSADAVQIFGREGDR